MAASQFLSDDTGHAQRSLNFSNDCPLLWLDWQALSGREAIV